MPEKFWASIQFIQPSTVILYVEKEIKDWFILHKIRQFDLEYS